MKIILSFAFLLFSLLVMSQTKRDIFLRDSIIKPINFKQVANQEIYEKTYILLKKWMQNLVTKKIFTLKF